MRVKKYALKVENGHVDIGDWVDLSGDLTVMGKSHLQNIVSIGTEPPQADGEETIGLNMTPELTVPVEASEVVGLKLQPTLNASNTGDKLTGLHINPVFENSAQKRCQALWIDSRRGEKLVLARLTLLQGST